MSGGMHATAYNVLKQYTSNEEAAQTTQITRKADVQSNATSIYACIATSQSHNALSTSANSPTARSGRSTTRNTRADRAKTNQHYFRRTEYENTY